MTTATIQNDKMPSHLEWRRPETLNPYANNARTHSTKQIRQIAESITRFGFTNPVLIGDNDEIIAGHGRVVAALQLNLDSVPVLKLSHLNEKERRAYILADNKLAENAGWDQELLAIELQALIDLEFDLDITGFEIVEVDTILKQAGRGEVPGRLDNIPARSMDLPACNTGDLWALGPHRLLCGDAQIGSNVVRLMGGQTANLIFTDPPYNVPIDGHVSGKGMHRHREFAFGSGEMSRSAFASFLTKTLSNAAAVSKDGAIAFVCMDWRHMAELLEAGEIAFTELKNLCVWNKSNAGMGSFYRSKHELVFVYKVGSAAHTNSFGLGENGRYRTNVWDYAGANVPTEERREALEMHPTVKPVAMIADAILDCSRRGERVLDIFGGSGSTLIAAQSCGRIAHLLEYDPSYCDTILERFAKVTGISPINAATGATWDAVKLASKEQR